MNMSDSTDRLSRIELAELMASKLCHDLVGPVGATANGAELLSDMSMEEEALALTSASATQAAKLLQYYRMAFGAAGSLRNDFEELRSVVGGLMELRGLELRLRIDGDVDAPLGAAKLLANLFGLASETLPRGGTLEGGLREEEGEIEIFAVAKGPGAQLREEARSVLDSSGAGEVTPRNVQAYYILLLTQQLGGELRSDAESDSVTLSAQLAATR